MTTIDKYLDPDESRQDLEEYIREREDEYRELAEQDDEFRPLIDAMLEDVVDEGVDS